MKIPKLLLKLKERAEAFLKTFEWNWTKAVIFCVIFPSSS